MLTMLYLIQINTYNSVKAPPKRGFSSIEVWFVGMQVPILIAIFEYGVLLAMKKFLGETLEEKNLIPEKLFRKVDLLFFIVCSVYFVLFTSCYFILYWINIRLLPKEGFWPPIDSITSEVKNNYNHVKK